MKCFFKKYKNAQTGFSLIELLVVAAIFIIITSVVMFNQNRFSSDISISNVAHSIALQIREAQVYGILVRQETLADGSANFNSAYGIHFRYASASDETIVYDLFIDSGPGNEPDYVFDESDDTVLSTTRLEEGNLITDVCTYLMTGSGRKCFSSDDEALVGVDIIFQRPDPAAIITDSSSDTVRKGEMYLVIQSALGDKVRTVKVLNTGLISVGNSVRVTNLLSSFDSSLLLSDE
jgi:prepilin-type N-terminal cleavage/methylation domain-containing protein